MGGAFLEPILHPQSHSERGNRMPRAERHERIIPREMCHAFRGLFLRLYSH